MDYASNKFDPKSLKCVFLDYNIKYKEYICLYPPIGRVYISRHVIFDENTFPFADTYCHMQDTYVTPLLAAWQHSFMPSAVTTEATLLPTTSVPSIITQSQSIYVSTSLYLLYTHLM